MAYLSIVRLPCLSGHNPSRAVFLHVRDGGRAKKALGSGWFESAIGDTYQNLSVIRPAAHYFTSNLMMHPFVTNNPIINSHAIAQPRLHIAFDQSRTN